MGINDDDGECLIPSQQRLMRDRIRIREQKVDGQYTSYRNIAHSGINGIRLHYRIEKDWVLIDVSTSLLYNFGLCGLRG
jgi:hypothetical protein